MAACGGGHAAHAPDAAAADGHGDAVVADTGALAPPGHWAAMTSNTELDLFSVWGSSPDAVWAVGFQNVAVFYDGTEWEVRSLPASVTGVSLGPVRGTGPDDVYLLADEQVLRFDGASWTQIADLSSQPVCDLGQPMGMSVPPQPGAGAYVGCFQIEEVAAPLALYHVAPDGTVAQVVSTTVDAACIGWDGVLARASDDILLAGCPGQRWDGSQLTPLGSGAGPAVTAFWSASPQVMFASDRNYNGGGDSRLASWSGADWAWLSTGFSGTLDGVSGTSGTRVMGVGSDASSAGKIVLYDGTGITDAVLPAGTPTLAGIWAAPDGEVFAVGAAGTILHGT
ncbi:MAG TPA: hypothetical protein VLX92_25255 [Kofleriaceae bacterium]|nr:hypothetical protein [Kofleriaceae bacterium]